ncbi:sugar efflux transporter for intercellular exchange-domain-containing protein [Blastocladiella britannica]|nr:sugar efflux transporter for intercellular exchange-domain-containing protein [Blastocladiella britannica]
MTIQCDSDACRVVLNTVIPICGVLTAISTAAAPIPAVLRVRRAQALGSLNPIPFAFIYINAAIWIMYGIYTRDIFVLAPNLLGILFGNFFVRSTYGYATASQRKVMDVVLVFGTFAVFLTAGIATLYATREAGQLALGVLSNIILAAFYVSPISVLVTVVKTRNSGPFDPILAFACMLNGTLWVIYGIAIGDFFVYFPNAIGSMFGLLQLALRVILPAHSEIEVVPTSSPLRVPGSPAGVLGDHHHGDGYASDDHDEEHSIGKPMLARHRPVGGDGAVSSTTAAAAPAGSRATAVLASVSHEALVGTSSH